MKLFIVLLFFCFSVNAQIDSSNKLHIIGIHLGGQIPGGNLVNRFGPNLDVGITYLFKTKKEWIFGIESNYIYSNNVKEDILKQLKNDEGNVTNNLGYPADVRLTQRGLGIHLITGRVFKIFKNHQNSGIMINIGVGYLQHKINIYDAEQKIAALQGDLIFGYDRLSLGLSFSQFIGYLHLSKNRLSNFYFGLSMYEAFTRNIRQINYDTGSSDSKQSLDLINGFRFGWILPLYNKKPNDFYYN